MTALFSYGEGLSLGTNQGESSRKAIVRLNEAIRLDPDIGKGLMLGRGRGAYNRSYQLREGDRQDYNTALVLGNFAKNDIARLRTGRG